MLNRFKRLKGDAKGATAVEYGLILALVVLAIMAAVINVANLTKGMWNHVANEVINH